uniref:Dynamin N-terminal domain-containing protein n=1 Tax=Ditylum brightwellii TaxID=49249 RepID=A0A7S4W6M9_9STRA
MPRDERTESIISHASHQAKPLKRGSGEDDNTYEEFFDVMAKVWRIADEHDLGGRITSTNFVMFGPQSAGKTTLVERILKFPVAVVKSDIATTRPMVLTTRRGDKETLFVKEEGGDFMPLDKTEVVSWVTQRMDTKLSEKRIFIEVTGPDYMNRRFVDLPGFQQNNDGTGSYRMIINLLRSELSNPNTVVVCVDTAKEFVNSNLVSAMREVFGDHFASKPDFSTRFVVALNKSDAWLGSAETTPDVFLNQIEKYKNFFGMVPILVGGSIDPNNRRLRENRARGTASFEEIVNEYNTANSRERLIYDSFQQGLDPQLSNCLLEKCVGFDNFLGAVDGLVINRDFGNVDKISNELLRVVDERKQTLSALKTEQKVIEELDQNVSIFVHKLLSTMNVIMTNDSGNDALGVLGSKAVIQEVGMTALEEEEEFASNYYNSNRRYELYDHHVGCNDRFDQPELHDVVAWKHAVRKTLLDLQSPVTRPSISYLGQKLIGGALYERSLAVWSSTAYSFLVPSEDDIGRLANIVGTDPEIAQSNQFKKAKRLAEIYMGQLTPALQYLCQKMEFILLKIFDTAWCSLMKKDYYANIAAAVGDSFKLIIKDNYRQAVLKSARLAYNRAFFDLDNEVHKLLPYQVGSPSVTAMKYAFPADKDNIERVMQIYYEQISENVKEHYKDELDLNSNDIGAQLQKGIIEGISILADGGVISPLLFAGITITRAALSVVSKSLEKQNRLAPMSAGKILLAEDLDQRSLGFAVGLYAHFLPRFIASIDGRMRAEIWSSVKNTPLNESIRQGVVKSHLIKKIISGYADINIKVDNFMKQVDTIESFRHELQFFLSKRPTPQLMDTCGTSGAIDPISSGNGFFLQEPQQLIASNTYDQPSSGGGIDISENQSISSKDTGLSLQQRLAAIQKKK